MENVRWGDLPIIPDTESGIAAIEREQIIKPRSMELEGPKLYQPSSIYPPKVLELSSEILFKDNIVMRTIKLIQHAKKLRAIVQSFQLQQENQKPTDVDGAFVYPPLPPMPISEDEIACLVEDQPLKKTEYCSKVEVILHQLDQQSTLNILNKAVAIICAHAGFEAVTSSVLRLLTDVTQEFFIKFTQSLRSAADNRNCGFVDVFEQVSHEMSLGSTKNLEMFYEKRILNYYKHTLRQCKQLIAEYDRLKQPDQQNEDIKIIKVKEENIAHIQFPVSEEQEELIDQTESVIHFEEFHTMEHSTTLGDDEGPRWPPSQKHETNTQHNATTLDSDEEIIENLNNNNG